MADADDVRRLALELPDVTEIDSDGFDFRVADKGFVWSYPERRPGRPRVIRTDIAVLYVGDEAEKQALLLGEPEAFFTTPAYDGLPLVMLRLAQVNLGACGSLSRTRGGCVPVAEARPPRSRQGPWPSDRTAGTGGSARPLPPEYGSDDVSRHRNVAESATLAEPTNVAESATTSRRHLRQVRDPVRVPGNASTMERGSS